MFNAKVLICDDQSHIIDALSLLLEPEGLHILAVNTPTALLKQLACQSVDLVLMDMNYSKDTTSGDEGIALINSIRAIDINVPIIVMTAWANIELSVKAIKLGANDFIEKPWNNSRLLSLISNHLSLAKIKHNNEKLSALTKSLHADPDIIGQSEAMQDIMMLIKRTAASDANILLTGESGVGKSLIAGHIHKLSERSKNPFVSVNMGALADSLFESELFGHQKGAFTDAKSNRMGRFEMAENGTLFLDEVANIPFSLQGKLLRILESGEYESLGSSKTKKADVRIVSASNVIFKEEVEKGKFRQDLLYRLNTITIDIPPLRERVQDILPLAEAFIHQFKHKYRRPELSFSKSTERELLQYQWPGNIRELSHCIERAVLIAENVQIEPQELGINGQLSGQNLDSMTLEQSEQYLIKRAMHRSAGSVSEAAGLLGISRSALYRRLEKYDDIDITNK